MGLQLAANTSLHLCPAYLGDAFVQALFTCDQ